MDTLDNMPSWYEELVDEISEEDDFVEKLKKDIAEMFGGEEEDYETGGLDQ